MNRRARQTGLTLVELGIGLVVLTTLISLGAPSFSEWLNNSQILTAAEGFQNGLQLARAEAVRRNVPVYFQATNTLADGCTASATGANWVVRLDDANGNCATSANIIQSRPAAEASARVALAAECATLTFNGMGQLNDRADCELPEDGQFDFNFSIPGGTCAAAGGPLRCRRVVVTLGGQVRICDPAVTDNTDPRVC